MEEEDGDDDCFIELPFGFGVVVAVKKLAKLLNDFEGNERFKLVTFSSSSPSCSSSSSSSSSPEDMCDSIGSEGGESGEVHRLLLAVSGSGS